MATMSAAAARKILGAKRPHADDCRRQELGLFDRSGNCERCSAFVALNEYIIPVQACDRPFPQHGG